MSDPQSFAAPPDDPQAQWTAKLPALVLGIVAIAVALLVAKGRWRYSAPIAVAMLVLGVSLVVFSTTVHGWCAPSTAKWGGGAFGQTAFWHGASVHDCVRMIYPHWR